MGVKDNHINYLKNKRKFTPDCNHAIFTLSEISLLEKYGNWFMGLTNGDLLPFNDSQEHFIKVAKKEIKPETDYDIPDLTTFPEVVKSPFILVLNQGNPSIM